MKENNKSPHPDWATVHRLPGTELRLIRGHYYLYAVTSKYDPTLKRAKKVTGRLLGTITQENGFLKSEKLELVEKASKGVDVTKISIRECGFTSFLTQYSQTIAANLKQFFPETAQAITYMAYTRLVHNSPIKNMAFHVSKSMLSINDKTSLSEKYFSTTLRDIGSTRSNITAYMQSFIKPNDYVMVDMTNMFSSSNKMRYSKEGYNSDMVFDKQFNLLYIYSPGLVQPVFYRLYSGNIREVKGFKLCIQESGIADAVVVADKGFYSKKNVENLQQEGLHYIIPLKRDSALIKYGKLQPKELPYFKFEDRYIWYTSYECQGQQLFLFKDDKLRVQEEKDYLDRIESLPEYYQIQKFYDKTERFGTIAILSNIDTENAEHVYTSYKSRNNIEVMFDGIKNVLHADRTYMQNEDALEGWMFINHIAIQWYYLIYTMLKQNKMLKRYSVSDFILHLYEIKKVRINDSWIVEPITNASTAMLEKLKIHIT